MIFKSNTQKALSYFFKYPHLKTFYKGGILDFTSIVNIYNNIIKKKDTCEIFGNFFHGLDPVNYFTLDEIFNSNIYDFTTTNKAPIIIDCGANIGLSILYFKRKHPNAIIHAFEPDTKNAGFLNQNIKSYGWEETVFSYKQLVSDEKGYEYFEELGNAGSKIVSENQQNESTVKIEKIRLKDFLTKLNSTIDFLKLDIEGSEFQVIPDIKDLYPKIEKMYIEFHCENNNFEEMYNYIKLHLSEHFNFQITTNFLENQNIYNALQTKNSKTYYNCFAVKK